MSQTNIIVNSAYSSLAKILSCRNIYCCEQVLKTKKPHIFLCMHVCMYVCLYNVCTCVHMYVRMYVCTYVYMFSKNPHKRTSGLRTLRLKFGQQSTTCIKIKSA